MISNEATIVRDALLQAGLETPMKDNGLTSDEKQARIQQLMTEVVNTLGMDLEDDSLAETPKRIAKMYVREIFSGLNYEEFPSVTTIENKMNVDEMICVNNIGVMSTCEHHFVTIDGLAKVAYLPNKKIIGLSKINRIVRFFARRPQVQERLTQQILIALQALLETPNVAVSINAVHYCVKSRGVMDESSSTSTTSLGGCFKTNASTRAEFLAV